MQTIRWGILGASNFALKHMAPAIHAAEGAEFAGLATSRREKAARFQAFCPALQIHDSYDALLADPAIEAVYLPLPNHLHVEWALKANRAGKHVLCEKPIALAAAEIDALIAARDRSGLMIAEAFMILHHPQWLRAREWCLAGEIGEIIHLDAHFTYRNLDAANIRNRPETGGGALRDIGIYTLGGARFVTGAEPLTLEARFRREGGVDTTAHVFGLMGQEGGAPFTYASTISMRAYARQGVTIQGSKGMIRLEGGCFNANVADMAAVELHSAGHVTHIERWPAVNQYRLQVENFGRTIRAGAPYPCPLEFSRATQAMMDMAFANGRDWA